MLDTQKLQPSDYVHLHNHTHYSVLDGLQKIPDLLARVKELGMSSVAITDHGTLSGVIEFYQAAKAAGIKPIIGMETYVAGRSHTDKDPQKDKQRHHLILLAMNQTGYQNLMRLSTIANLDGFYYKPRVDHALLEKYNEGLIVLSGCIGGEVSENFRHDNDNKAREIAEWYKSIFGDRYYLEIQDHQNWAEQKKVNTKLLELGKELDIPVVVTCDAHYLKHEDRDAHEILLCVGTSSYLSDQDRMSLKDFDLFVTNPLDVIKRWGEKYPEVITNTKAIADRCNVELEFGKILIPKFDVPEGETEKTYLDKLVFRGLAERYARVDRMEAKALSVDEARQKLDKRVLDRADYELGVFDSMGFNGYMLIVQDLINWGKNQGIIFSLRGSAAGSIISYAIRITDIDPLAYDLFFERFLNPARISMPDVDIDIQDTRRDEVIQYCVEKYGTDRVANIATFGKMAARNAIRDVARVMQVSYADADRWAKLVPPPVQGRHTPLRIIVAKDPDLKKEYESNPTAKQVFDFAMILDGTIRSHGVHAAGVVITPEELVKYVPLEMSQKGVVATQYKFTQVEDLGLLKIDFLGLSNLTTIKNALRIIKRVYGVDIDLETMPLDDPKTFSILASGDTTGVFQLESAGMKRYLKELRPTVFEDIISMVALYRPGPMQWIDDFIDRKHGRKPITYFHPAMEPALKSTYGIIVTQEQVMQIATDMCGFTGSQADTLRKGVAKKIPEVLAKMKPAFIDGAVKISGANRDDMEKFWKQIEAFGAYCFNKAHSACYAMVAYQTAYLKSNYPAAFMAALMTSDQDDTDRLAIEIAECQHMNMQVLAPDVNQSFSEFAVVPDTKQIRFGMSAVKNVGSNAVEEIIRVREDSGEFTSIEDFAKRVSSRMVNRKSWESLIKAGAFDSLGSRSDLLFNLDTILAFASKSQKDAASGQVNLFGDMLATLTPDMKLESAPTRHTEREQLQWERELLGLYLSAHPLDQYDSYFEEQTVPIDKITKEMDGKQVIVGGIITSSRVINTKNGAKMAFVAIEDKSGNSEIIVFPKLYETTGEHLIQDAVVRIKGKISAKDKEGRMTDDIKIIADEVNFITEQELDDYKPTGKKSKTPKAKKAEAEPVAAAKITAPLTKLYVHVKDPADHHTLLKLKQTFNQYPGSSEVVLVLGADKKSAIRLPFKVTAEDELQQQIIGLYGADCVALQA